MTHGETIKPRITQPIYFKYQARWTRRPNYGMITTSGYDIKVWNIGSIRTIDVDEIETYVEDVQDEIERIKSNHEDFEYITMQEFYAEFEQVHTKISNIVKHETYN